MSLYPDELVLRTMVVVEPKGKKKYKTEKEKEKDAIVEDLITLGQIMIGEQLHVEEAQSIRDLVEEVVKALPQKIKKNTKGKDEVGSSKAKAHEKLLPPSFEGRKKRGAWAFH
jgi:hypothetical protein